MVRRGGGGGGGIASGRGTCGVSDIGLGLRFESMRGLADVALCALSEAA